MQYYIECLKKYAVFSGRARRKEFWMFFLFNIIIQLAIILILGNTANNVYSLAIILPTLAVTVRRLHDVGMSGWWVLILFVPLLGVLVLLGIMTNDSQSEDNKYGPNPKI